MYIYWFSAFVGVGVHVCIHVRMHTHILAYIYMAKIKLSKFNLPELTHNCTTVVFDILNR